MFFNAEAMDFDTLEHILKLDPDAALGVVSASNLREKVPAVVSNITLSPVESAGLRDVAEYNQGLMGYDADEHQVPEDPAVDTKKYSQTVIDLLKEEGWQIQTGIKRHNHNGGKPHIMNHRTREEIVAAQEEAIKQEEINRQIESDFQAREDRETEGENAVALANGLREAKEKIIFEWVSPDKRQDLGKMIESIANAVEAGTIKHRLIMKH